MFSKIVISILIIILVIFVMEFYLRHKSTYVTEEHQSSKKVIEGVPGSIVMSIPKEGNYYIPDSHVVIHNHHISGRDILMDINSLGFRDEEISKDKKSDELRILILGDSITSGDYLQRDEVYVEHIEKYLNELIKTKTINVINAGIGDSGLKKEMDVLFKKGLTLEPDIVIVGFYLNDSRPPWGFSGEIAYRNPLRRWLQRHSLLANKLYYNLKLDRWLKNEGGIERFQWVSKQHALDWANNREDFFQLVSLSKYDWGAGWDKSSWDIIDQEFNKLKLLSDQHNFRVVIISFPVSFQVYTNFIEDTPQQILREKAVSRGFYYFDLLPVLRRERNENLFFDHCHPNKKANDIIGKAIAEFIKKEMLSDIN